MAKKLIRSNLLLKNSRALLIIRGLRYIHIVRTLSMNRRILFYRQRHVYWHFVSLIIHLVVSRHTLQDNHHAENIEWKG